MWRNKDGNVAMVTALMLFSVLALLGGAVDFARYVQMKTDLDSAVEAAVLAAASLSQTGETPEVIADFLNTQILPGQFRDQISFEVLIDDQSFSSSEIRIVASGDFDTFFLPLLGIDEMQVSSSATATQSANNVEVSLVLDVSGSMGGSKITNMRDAATDFVDTIFAGTDEGQITMSVVPFAASVNVAPIFDQFAYDMDTATVDPSGAQYNIGSNVPDGSFRFTGSRASSCIELRDEDFDDLDRLPLESRPEIALSTRYADAYFCPTNSRNEVFLNSSDADDLKDMIDDLQADGYTAINEGAAWGAYALSPSWRGSLGGDEPDRPADFGTGVAKALVIMTDGEMNQGVRVAIDGDSYCTGWGWRRRCYTRDGAQWIRNNGRASDTPATDSASGQLKRVCDYAKSQSIIIYTIGFDISEGGDSDLLLEYCATDPDTHYFFVDDIDNIDEAFAGIAASINALRIKG